MPEHTLNFDEIREKLTQGAKETESGLLIPGSGTSTKELKEPLQPRELTKEEQQAVNDIAHGKIEIPVARTLDAAEKGLDEDLRILTPDSKIKTTSIHGGEMLDSGVAVPEDLGKLEIARTEIDENEVRERLEREAALKKEENNNVELMSPEEYAYANLHPNEFIIKKIGESLDGEVPRSIENLVKGKGITRLDAVKALSAGTKMHNLLADVNLKDIDGLELELDEHGSPIFNREILNRIRQKAIEDVNRGVQNEWNDAWEIDLDEEEEEDEMIIETRDNTHIVSPSEFEEISVKVAIKDLLDHTRRSTRETTRRLALVDDEITITKSEPGVLEKSCLTILDAWEDCSAIDVRSKGAKEQLQAMEKLLVEYERLNEGPLPSMPDLSQEIISNLKERYSSGQDRESLYKCLSCVELSQQEKENILEVMQENNDLLNPLAYRCHVSLSIENPESTWVSDQMERIEELRELCKGSTQEQINQYQHLMQKAKKIVLAGEVPSDSSLDDLRGASGIEIELHPKSENIWNTKINPAFEIDYDIDNIEIRTKLGNIYRDSSHFEETVDLSDFISREAAGISSLHIHLDRREFDNPNRRLGEIMIAGALFDEYRIFLSTVKPSALHDTYEVRSLLVPGQKDSLRVASIDNVQDLFYYANSSSRAMTESNLSVPDNATLEQLVFGHICEYAASPEARVAALKCLEDPLMFKSVNLFALYDTYGQDNIEELVEIAKRDAPKSKVSRLQILNLELKKEDEAHELYLQHDDATFASIFLGDQIDTSISPHLTRKQNQWIEGLFARELADTTEKEKAEWLKNEDNLRKSYKGFRWASSYGTSDKDSWSEAGFSVR